MSAIEFKGVSRRWGDVTALHPSDLRVEPGTFAVLLGPSGCGKSTTLRLIAGLDSPSEGAIFINDRDVTTAPPVARDVAMVFQNYALFPHLTVADNILFGLQVRKTPRAVQQERLQHVLSVVGLEQLAARKPSQLSGGQQQRVALARAIVAQKTVCLMDEPLSNLDAKLRQEMRAELRDLQQKLKLTVVYVTHDQTEAMSMADQVILMNQGRIEQAATPREMYAAPQTTFAAKFIGTPSMSLLDVNNPALASSAAVAARPSNAATLGVRPEDVSISREPSRGTSAVSATVASVEYLGADSILRCNVGDALLHARVLGQARWDANTPVFVDWPASANHWFDANGQRVIV